MLLYFVHLAKFNALQNGDGDSTEAKCFGKLVSVCLKVLGCIPFPFDILYTLANFASGESPPL